MAFQKIGIMSIGEMGFHWAKLLKSHGVEVLTFDQDRGEVSRKRGENAGVKSVGSMAELVLNAELIVSIVVPSAAARVAAKVAEAVKTAGRNLASRGREFCRRWHYWFGSQNRKGNDRLCFRSSGEPAASFGRIQDSDQSAGREHQPSLGFQSSLCRSH